MEITKKCSKCKEEKKTDEFGIKKYNKDGLNHYCKICENNRTKKRYYNPGVKEQRKYYQLFKNYGLTKDEYLLKLKLQNYKCSLCKTELLNDKNTHVDHSHKTGEVREILCQRCNSILGMVNENIDYLKKVIDYIEKYSPQK